MTISDEALEAGAKAYQAKVDWIDRHSRDDYGRELELGILAALEAAAPYMLAQVWLEGYREGAMYGALGANGHEPPNQRNPYRSQATL